jgi:hypothetical protein
MITNEDRVAMIRFTATQDVFKDLDALGVGQHDPLRFLALRMIDAAIERALAKERLSELH